MPVLKWATSVRCYSVICSVQCSLQRAVHSLLPARHLPALPDLLLDVSQLLLQLLDVPEAGVPPAVVEHQGGLAGSGLLALHL